MYSLDYFTCPVPWSEVTTDVIVLFLNYSGGVGLVCTESTKECLCVLSSVTERLAIVTLYHQTLGQHSKEGFLFCFLF